MAIIEPLGKPCGHPRHLPSSYGRRNGRRLNEQLGCDTRVSLLEEQVWLSVAKLQLVHGKMKIGFILYFNFSNTTDMPEGQKVNKVILCI